jgi:fused signal recognition particle receptor
MFITKLDGTSKGGIVIDIVNEVEIPVPYIGIGEQVEELKFFDAKQFAESFFALVLLNFIKGKCLQAC